MSRSSISAIAAAIFDNLGVFINNLQSSIFLVINSVNISPSNFDSLILKCGTAGKVNKIKIDTHHFKGNYPDKCSVQAAFLNSQISSKSIVKKSKNWKLLLNKVKLHAHKKHNFNNSLIKNKKVNYIRLNIYPDGGISRIRVLCKTE